VKRGGLLGVALLFAGCAPLIDWDSLRGTGAGDAGVSGDGGAGGYAQQVLSDGPVAYFRLDDAVGATTAADIAPGGPSTRVSPAGVRFQAQGLLHGDPDPAAYFDASQGGNIVVSGTSLDFQGNHSFTLEFWMEPDHADAATNYTRILSAEQNPGDPNNWAGFYVGTYPAGMNGISFSLWASGKAVCSAADNQALPTGPIHVAAVYDATRAQVSLWLNATQYGASPCTPNLAEMNAPFTIGGSSVGGPFYWGTLDEVAIYDTALPAARIQAHYAAGK
jgi:hypothetical protein